MASIVRSFDSHNLGAPLTDFIKPITRSQIAHLWITKCKNFGSPTASSATSTPLTRPILPLFTPGHMLPRCSGSFCTPRTADDTPVSTRLLHSFADMPNSAVKIPIAKVDDVPNGYDPADGWQ